jgi:hypothetical protein
MEKEQINKLAITTATLIADISQKKVMAWKSELEVLKNISIHPSAFGTLLLEASIFGHYYVGEKFKKHITNKEDKKLFSDELNDKMIFAVSLILESNKSKDNYNEHKKEIKETYEHFAPTEHESYSTYKGDNITELFRERLRQTFNNCDKFKIMFFENNLKTRIMMKVAGIISGSDDKYSSHSFLDNKIIYNLADNLFSEFALLDYNQLNKNLSDF